MKDNLLPACIDNWPSQTTRKKSIKTMSCIHLNLGSPAGEDSEEINLELDTTDGSTIKTIQVT
jgi:hypothetical protein